MRFLFYLYYLFFLFSVFPLLPSRSQESSPILLTYEQYISSSEFLMPNPDDSILPDIYSYPFDSNYFVFDSSHPTFLSCFLPYSFAEYLNPEVDLFDSLIWTSLCDSAFSSNKLSWSVVEKDVQFPPSYESNFPSFELTESDVDFLMKQVPLSPKDFTESFRSISSFPSFFVLPHNTWSVSTLLTSSFGGSNSAANKNFTAYYDLGLTSTSTFSLFYSNADDPLNPPLLDDTNPLWLSWELTGFSLTHSLVNDLSYSLYFNSSLEVWGVTSIVFDDDIDSDSLSTAFDNYLIGSVSLLYTWSLLDSLKFTLSPGVNLLPSTLSHDGRTISSFFGITPYIASGFIWQPSTHFDLFAGLSVPLGMGSNVFTSDLELLRVPVFSLGSNFQLNPRSYISASLSNGFGSSSATNLLTTPMQDTFNYSLSFSYFPDLLDSPHLPFTDRQLLLANSGLFVSSAVLPPENSFSVSIGSTTNRNLYTSVAYSLSNQVLFRFDNIWFDHSGALFSDVSTAFFHDDSIGSTISTSFNFLSPLRGSAFWSSATLSFGRNSYISNSSPLGFSFLSLDNTFEFSNDFAFNVSPKFLVSGFGMLSGVGFTANFPFFGEFEFIPGLNLVYDNLDFDQSNISASVLWRISDSRSLEFYISNARSPIDIGQMQRSDFFSLGFNTRFYF